MSKLISDKNMNILGATKGTALEEKVDQLRKGEAQGANMYAALACLAKEKGLNEVSEKLIGIANDELRHAALYTVLNGHTKDNLFEVLKKIAPIETAGVEQLQQFAKQVHDLGQQDAAEHIESAALDEGRHGQILSDLIERFSQNK